MKIFEVIKSKNLGSSRAEKSVDKDWEDDDQEQDADQDEVPNIIQQLRKAIDVDGNYAITFKDGKKTKLSMDEITSFVKKYMTAKPSEKEELQNQAIQSIDGFKQALAKEIKKPQQHKIKGNNYFDFSSSSDTTN